MLIRVLTRYHADYDDVSYSQSANCWSRLVRASRSRIRSNQRWSVNVFNWHERRVRDLGRENEDARASATA